MRTYISGALLNAADLTASRDLYEALARVCRSVGYEVYVPHEHADPVRDAELTNRQVADRDLAEIADADCLVAWLGEPSLGVGAEIAIALSSGKRVLALAPADRRVSRFLLGLLERHPDQASVCRYRDRDDGLAWVARTLGALVL